MAGGPVRRTGGRRAAHPQSSPGQSLAGYAGSHRPKISSKDRQHRPGVHAIWNYIDEKAPKIFTHPPSPPAVDAAEHRGLRAGSGRGRHRRRTASNPRDKARHRIPPDATVAFLRALLQDEPSSGLSRRANAPCRRRSAYGAITGLRGMTVGYVSTSASLPSPGPSLSHRSAVSRKPRGSGARLAVR